MERQFTATVYIVEDNKTLLIKHPKHGKWLPPGGHLEQNETPPEAAIREAFEETGLKVELIKDEHIWIERRNAWSFERPWLCLIENMPAHGNQSAHQHIDFIYLGKPISGNVAPEARWFTLEEVLALRGDQEIFVETQETLVKIFGKALQPSDP